MKTLTKKDLFDLLIALEEGLKTSGKIKINSVLHCAIEYAIKTELNSKVLIYDNGGKTIDRFTIFSPNGDVFGMNQDGKEFNLFLGNENEIEKGDHLGKPLKEIPNEILFPVLQRVKFAI